MCALLNNFKIVKFTYIWGYFGQKTYQNCFVSIGIKNSSYISLKLWQWYYFFTTITFQSETLEYFQNFAD